MHRIAATASLLLLAALPLRAQQPSQFGEKVDVNVVLIDAVVTDSKGHQILGLGKDDFIVKENGTPQQIESVDYFTNRRLLTAREQDAPFKVERVRDDRYFIFFFDKPQEAQLFDRVRLARDAALKFVDNDMLPGDRVAIVGHDVRLKVYSDFTSDKATLHKALDDVMFFSNGLKESTLVPDTKKMVDKTGTVFEALTVLGDSLHAIKARKNLVLFSAGIVAHDEDVRGGLLVSRSRYYDPMIHALNASNVTVYTVNLQADTPETPLFHQNLETLAHDTNGEYFRHNVTFANLVHRIEETNNGYYLITYTAQKPRGSKGYQKVAVALKNPEFRIKAREGYTYGE
jgi:VWFA-related protein